MKQKSGFSVISRHARNPPTEVGQELAGIIVHGAKRLHRNGLEDVLVFQCAVFSDLVGGGQLSNSTGGGGYRLEVRLLFLLNVNKLLRDFKKEIMKRRIQY